MRPWSIRPAEAEESDLAAESTPSPPSGAKRSWSRELPLSVPDEHRDLFRRLFDPDHMLAVFQRELPPRAEGAIRVTTCDARPGRSEKSFKRGRLQLVYTVGVEVGNEPPRDYLLLGVSPVPAAFLGPEVEERNRRLLGHPAVAPFRRLALHIEELQLGLFLFPVDPMLPGLAEITGSGGAQLLSGMLPECRAGARVERIECELRHYKPFNRAVLCVRVPLAHPDTRASERTVYVKVFDTDRGAANHRELADLWSFARRSIFLRVPEPLGYDADRRLLVMSAAPGERNLNDWIRCIRKGQPLPGGVELERVERCFRIAALALGELQGSGLRPHDRYTYQHELAHLRRDREHLDKRVRDSHPELLSRFEALRRRLEALSPLDEPLVPAHGEFRHQQLVGDEHLMTVIDWDSYCLANPALDAARLLARLHRDALICPEAAPSLDRLAEAFREEFLAPRPGVATHLALYEGLHLTKQMLRSFGATSRGEDVGQQIRLLGAEAEALLERAEAELA